MKTRSQYRFQRVRITDNESRIDFDFDLAQHDDSVHSDVDNQDDVDREHENAAQ